MESSLNNTRDIDALPFMGFYHGINDQGIVSDYHGQLRLSRERRRALRVGGARQKR